MVVTTGVPLALRGGGQRCCSAPQSAQDGPTSENNSTLMAPVPRGTDTVPSLKSPGMAPRLHSFPPQAQPLGAWSSAETPSGEDAHEPIVNLLCCLELRACKPTQAAFPLAGRFHLNMFEPKPWVFPSLKLSLSESAAQTRPPKASRCPGLSSFRFGSQPASTPYSPPLHPGSDPPGSAQPAAVTRPCHLSFTSGCALCSDLGNPFKLSSDQWEKLETSPEPTGSAQPARCHPLYPLLALLQSHGPLAVPPKTQAQSCPRASAWAAPWPGVLCGCLCRLLQVSAPCT